MLQEALKSVDLNQQPHLKGAYCFYGGYYAELLEQMKLNEEAEHFYKKIFDLQVSCNGMRKSSHEEAMTNVLLTDLSGG